MTDADLAFQALRGYQIGDWVLTRMYGGDQKVRGQIFSKSKYLQFWGVLVGGMELERCEDEMVPCE